MTDLTPCRWREQRDDGTPLCRSEKYIGAPNRVSAKFCRTCAYAEDGPADGSRLPRANCKHIEVYAPKPSARAPTEIAIATMYTPDIVEMGRLAADALRSYAGRHGYTAIVANASLDESRRPHWSKIILIAHYLTKHPSCRWLMWIDSDAVITKPNRPIEPFLDETVDFVVAEDIPPSPINTGVFFVRNGPAVLDWLRRAYAKVELISPHWGEQKALAAAMRDSPSSLRTRIVPRRLFNSFSGSYEEKDFVIHFAGCSQERKRIGVRKAVQEAYFNDTVRPRHPEPDVPVHSYREDYQRLLRGLMPRQVVEWGPGLNTELALAVGAETISIEHQTRYLPKKTHPRLTVLFAPKDGSMYCFFPDEADVYFVDGRNRARCLNAVFDRCREDAVVCLHDAQRAAYRSALTRFPYVIEPSLGFAVATKGKARAKQIAKILGKS